jgi:FAD/FMN-containing dehydrogenase
VSLAVSLSDLIGPAHVLTDPELTAAYGTDWTGRWSQQPVAVVRPATTAEVSDVVRCCSEHGTALTAQGGNTGLVGGSVPGPEGCVVLSTRRLQRLDHVDPSSRQVTAAAGVTVASLQDHAAAAGLAYGVDLASRDSATVGGTIATNAGGIRVVAFGDTRAQGGGLEAVLADGSIMSHLTGLPKDSAGYDISGLLVGSEGTLAVVTAARLRLVSALPSQRFTALVGVATVEEALDLLRQDDLLAAEVIVGHAMDLVCDVTDLQRPLRQSWPLYVLIETAAEPRLADSADAVIDRRVWAYRERQPEAVRTLGLVHALDVAIPLDQLGRCIEELPGLVKPHGCYIFGHLAEGNLHVQIVPAAGADRPSDAAVLRYVADLGGSISAEHGVGRAKSAYLPWSRDSAQLRVMRQIKHALDPHGLLNPGVLFA